MHLTFSGTPDEFQAIFGHADLRAALVALTQGLITLQQEATAMSTQLDHLTQAVQDTSGVVDSAIVLLNGLSAQIRALSADPAALEALADTMDAKASELSAAVIANSPPPVEPTP